MRAAVYLRISEDKSGDEAGVTRQREDCDALIRQRGWIPAGVYPENDTSAAGKVARPQFAALLAAIKRGEVQAVVAWALDRLVRTSRDRLALVELCQRHGVVIALVRGSDMDPTTPAGRLTLGILGEVAQHEIDQKADRQRRAALQRASEGKPWCSRRPFGYEPGGMVVRAAEAKLIKKAYETVLAGGSVRGIATELNAAGVATSTGARWHGATVHQLLRNARYAGIRTRGRDTAREEVGRAKWPAIVDEGTYRTVMAILTDPSRRVGAGRERRYLLTGLVRCGRCDRPMGSGRATSTGARTYVCKGAAHLSRAGEPVDDLVTRHVVERLSQPDALALLADDSRPDTDGLRAEALALRGRLDSLATEFADGNLTASQLRVATERLRAKLADVEARMVTGSRASVLAELVRVDDVAVGWEALTLDRQRAVVDVLMTVTILPAGRGRGFDPDTVRIAWKSAVTKKSLGSVKTRKSVRADLPEQIDPDTARLERDPGSGGWRVLAGLAAAPSTVVPAGVLEPAYGTGRRTVRGWYAADDHLMRVPGGPWRTRREAVAHLLMRHERATTRQKRP
jgi:site-specific DNA recombinase